MSNGNGSVWRAQRELGVQVPLQRPLLPSLEDAARYYARSERERWYSNNGPCVSLLRDRIEQSVGARAIVVANCTLGLVVAIRAAVLARRTSNRRYVVCPSYTFVATASAIRSAGFEPVFVDADPVHWQPDHRAIDAAIAAYGDDIAAVLAASTFGCPPDAAVREHWERSCRDAGIPLVVDSAAAFGANDELGRPLGRQGDVEVFSFHATKPFAVGEGGVVTTDDPEIADQVERMINFGFDSKRIVVTEGTNAKMPELTAAMGLAAWDGFDAVLTARRLRARLIADAVAAAGFSRQQHHLLGTWQLVPVLAPTAAERTSVLERAHDSGVELRCYYDQPLHTSPYYRDCPVIGDMSVTDDLARRTLSLPMCNDLSVVEVVRIVEAVTGFDASDEWLAEVAAALADDASLFHSLST